MIEPTIFMLSRIRYEEMLQEAEQARRFRHLRAGGFQAWLRQTLGNYLISSGQKLKDRPQSEAASPFFQGASRS